MVVETVREPSPLEEETGSQDRRDQRLQDYLTRMHEQAQELAPWLARLDMEALRRVEESYQRELHGALFALRHEDQHGVMEAMGWIKGARALLTWIESKRRVVG